MKTLLAATASLALLAGSALAAVPGPLLVQVPWIELSPGAQTVLQELDRHRWLPAGLAGAAVALGALSLLVARRRGLALLLLGVMLAAAAWLLRPLATEATAAMVASSSREPATGGLAEAFVQGVFTGWSAVSGALIAIGVALAVLGLVFGLRSRGRG